MKRLNGWVVWGILAALLQLATVTISAAEATHSRHYDGHSVIVGTLICTGVELILTVLFVLYCAIEWEG